MAEPSERMMRLVREMVSIAATDWTEPETDQFLDAISPGLRRRLLLEHLSGAGYKVVVDPNVKDRQKINAIKEIRAATGLGLREAKDLVDSADGYSTVVSNDLPAHMSSENRQRLAQNLYGTGYKLV